MRTTADERVSLETKLTASDGAANDAFGYSVSASADGNTLLVGSFLDAYPAAGEGSAYLYKWDGSKWGETKIGAPDGTMSDRFGNSAAVSSDGTTMAVGAYYSEVGLIVEQGAVYVFK